MIIVVDDDEVWRATLRDALEYEGFTVVDQPSGQRLADLVERDRPDVLILDDQLPGVLGLDLLVSLRARWPALPVVIVSAFGGPRTAALARHRGATRYVDKPFPLGTLIDELWTLVRGDEPDERLPRAARRTQPPATGERS